MQIIYTPKQHHAQSARVFFATIEQKSGIEARPQKKEQKNVKQERKSNLRGKKCLPRRAKDEKCSYSGQKGKLKNKPI
jgi:hypothetical protein